jgi:hypothetical protein
MGVSCVVYCVLSDACYYVDWPPERLPDATRFAAWARTFRPVGAQLNGLANTNPQVIPGSRRIRSKTFCSSLLSA